MDSSATPPLLSGHVPQDSPPPVQRPHRFGRRAGLLTVATLIATAPMLSGAEEQADDNSAGRDTDTTQSDQQAESDKTGPSWMDEPDTWGEMRKGLRKAILATEGQYCSEVTPSILGGMTYTETRATNDPSWSKENRSGAMGAFQFIPETWKWLGGGPLSDRNDFHESANLAKKYLCMLIREEGSLDGALSRYSGNAGGYASTVKKAAKQYRKSGDIALDPLDDSPPASGSRTTTRTVAAAMLGRNDEVFTGIDLDVRAAEVTNPTGLPGRWFESEAVATGRVQIQDNLTVGNLHEQVEVRNNEYGIV